MPKQQAELEVRKRIEVEGNHQQMERLCLDDIPICTFTPIMRRLLQSCLSLEYLTINTCQLISLDGFPKLPSLITLQLSENDLSGSLQKLQYSVQLTFLSLGGNNFDKISELAVLTFLPELEILIVHQNPITDQPDYRQQIFAVLPSVRTIDCYDRDDHFHNSEGQDSYITDKYHSLNNLDELPRLAETNGVQKQEQRSTKNPLYQVENDMKMQQNHSVREPIAENKAINKRRNRIRPQNSSDQEQPDQMIIQFKRKIQKQQ